VTGLQARLDQRLDCRQCLLQIHVLTAANFDQQGFTLFQLAAEPPFFTVTSVERPAKFPCGSLVRE
jgi:hypothetical protein